MDKEQKRGGKKQLSQLLDLQHLDENLTNDGAIEEFSLRNEVPE